MVQTMTSMLYDTGTPDEQGFSHAVCDGAGLWARLRRRDDGDYELDLDHRDGPEARVVGHCDYGYQSWFDALAQAEGLEVRWQQQVDAWRALAHLEPLRS